MDINLFFSKLDNLLREYSRILRETYSFDKVVLLQYSDEISFGKHKQLLNWLVKHIRFPLFVRFSKKFIIDHIRENLTLILSYMNLFTFDNLNNDERIKLKEKSKEIENLLKSIPTITIPKFILILALIIFLYSSLIALKFSETDRSMVISFISGSLSLDVEKTLELLFNTRLYQALGKIILLPLGFSSVFYVVIAYFYKVKRMLFHGSDRHLSDYTQKKYHAEYKIKKGCYLIEREVYRALNLKPILEIEYDLIFKFFVGSMPFIAACSIFFFIQINLFAIILVFLLIALSLIYTVKSVSIYRKRQKSMESVDIEGTTQTIT